MFSSFVQRQQREILFHILKNLHCGVVQVTMPDGSQHKFVGHNSGPDTDLHFHHNRAISRLLRDGKMGFCESFMDGDISCNNLPAFIELAARHDQYFEQKLRASMLRKWGLKVFHWLRHNSKKGSARNIAHHYDLGNAFYQAWLDASMTYSSAVFERDDEPLSDAQRNKYRRLAVLADIQPDDHVLEIGCGWGGFALYTAGEIGAKVTGITISKEQFSYAQKAVAAAGLENKVTLKLMDYRDLTGKYDKIVSIEMFEAVGQRYWPLYFATLSRVLKQGGRAALQSITISDEAFQSYCGQPDFIQRYIFPGGMLPSLPVLEEPLAKAGLQMVSETGFADDYAKTLDYWRQQFNLSWPYLASGKFDERFKRMWNLYLAYCEGGFRSGLIDVKQMLLTHR